MALLRVEGMSIYMSSVDMLTRLAIRRYAEVFYGVGVSQIVRGMKIKNADDNNWVYTAS